MDKILISHKIGVVKQYATVKDFGPTYCRDSFCSDGFEYHYNRRVEHGLLPMQINSFQIYFASRGQ